MDALTATTATEGRRERKKRAMRAHIYQTARGLFIENGFEATTVEQIAAAADIAQATFFNHFPSKHAVLAEMTSEVFDRLQRLIDEQLLQPGTAQERIAAFADSAATAIEEAGGLARDVLVALVRTTVRHGEVAPYLSRAHEPFTAIIVEGQRAGNVRTDLAAPFLAEMVVGAFNAAITNWINDASYPLEDRLRQVAAFVADAVEPRPAGPAS